METQTESTPTRRQAPSDATGHMAVMNHEGDTKHYWNAKDPEQVEMARATFVRYRSQQYIAFQMNAKGEQVTDGQMTEFDPEAESILFLPQFQGG